MLRAVPSRRSESFLEAGRKAHAFESSPISTTPADRYLYGGIRQVIRSRFVLVHAAGQVERRSMARADEPRVSPNCGLAPAANGPIGLQPRCVQMPSATRYSGLIDRYSLRIGRRWI